jgi:hypothetical protein
MGYDTSTTLYDMDKPHQNQKTAVNLVSVSIYGCFLAFIIAFLSVSGSVLSVPASAEISDAASGDIGTVSSLKRLGRQPVDVCKPRTYAQPVTGYHIRRAGDHRERVIFGTIEIT